MLTQNNMAAPQSKPDGVAVADWSLDEHMTGKYAVPAEEEGGGGAPGELFVTLEGNFWPSVTPSGENWCDVPFGAMVPKRGTGANLLVPVCLSASAVAYSSAHIENMVPRRGGWGGRGRRRRRGD